MQSSDAVSGDHATVIAEGQAKIQTAGHVFCNPVQEFNRDLSIAVLSAFARISAKEQELGGKIKDDVRVDLTTDESPFAAGKQHDNGLYILEALAATGLRSIRYAKEVAGIKKIIANDISQRAVEDMQKNIHLNGVNNLVTASLHDAMMLMYEHKKDQFDAIDLDPYGCPSIFIDSAVQSVKEGGLLLITATDMAVLAGNSPETCYAKYGAVSLRMRSCHEMALRILLQSVESVANRYGRYIVPQLCISADFYIRIFVRVYTSPNKCKYTSSKLSMVHHCTGCGSFELQPLGKLKTDDKTGRVKFCLPTSPFVGVKCEHCNHPYHMGGPIWSAPYYNPDFVQQVLLHASPDLGTYKRIEGVLNVVLEELPNTPLYYTLEKFSGTLHVETPPMMTIRSALLNAGYQVSYTHANKTSIKTDAPSKVLWDIMKLWIKTHPIAQKWIDHDKVTANIVSQTCDKEYSFVAHPNANPESRRVGYTRFQANPTAYWGPGSRAKAMVGIEKMAKSGSNQGKRKRIGDGKSFTETADSDLKEMLE